MHDPKLDLVLERVLDVLPETVWRAGTESRLLEKWFCPRRWMAAECEIDLRLGGTFHTVLQGPSGTTLDNPGCYLEVVPNRPLVFTTALGPGYRLQDPYVPFTAIVRLEPKGKGTRYHVLARHKDEATVTQHVEMGFHEGWSKALDQLVEMANTGWQAR
jgi:uncharacterized protein YndB with AHSA1/START domain